MSLSDKCVITAALAGGGTFKGQNPAVPYTPEEFADEAYKAYSEGCSIVHIHARDPKTGAPTPNIDIIRDVVDAIRAKCPVLINLSTAITVGIKAKERIAPVKELKPELASLNCNTMNFARPDYATGVIMFEFVFENTFEMMVMFAKAMREAGTKPELEVYDVGHINNIMFVRQQGLLEEPLHFQFVFGVCGGIPFSPANLIRMRESIPADATWSVCGVSVHSYPAAFISAVMGGHIRVGLEDNINVSKGVLAKGNYELVQKAVQIAKLAEREIATVDETRELLNLPKRA
ncbi:MAG: 3-keto-5-aminohexanoate cleavage protein [bacterium]